jgi:hypothetical protein
MLRPYCIAAGGGKLNCLAELAQGDLQAQKGLKIAIFETILFIVLEQENKNSSSPTYHCEDDGIWTVSIQSPMRENLRSGCSLLGAIIIP